MRVFVPSQSNDFLAKALDSSAVAGLVQASDSSRRSVHWDLEDAARNLAWIRGSIVEIGKNIVGPRWTFVKVKEFEEEATNEALAEIKRFYGFGQKRDKKKNIKDYYTTAGKFYVSAVALSLGGFAAWEIKPDNLFGKAAGFDFVPGYVEPQVDGSGNFKSPAWKQFLYGSSLTHAEWKKPEDIVLFANPDFGGYPFSSDLEALVQYTLPSDLYAALSYLNIHKFRSAPLDGYWTVDPTVSDEAFNAFVALLRTRYTGAKNYSKSPIVAKGQVDFKEMHRQENEAPYQKGRDMNRQEIGAVTGVHGSKLGVDGQLPNKDTKRDYHESVIEPIHVTLEDGTYDLIHVDLLGIRGWKLKFLNPAFVNEVEQTSIDTRRVAFGINCPNEIRVRDGLEPREGGDAFQIPGNVIIEEQGSRYRPSDEDTGDLAPSEENPTAQKPRPVRADEQSIASELIKWRTVELKKAKGEKKKGKRFVSDVVPKELYDTLMRALEIADGDVAIVKEIFELAILKVKGD